MLLAVSMADAESHTHAAFIDDDPVGLDVSNTVSRDTLSPGSLSSKTFSPDILSSTTFSPNTASLPTPSFHEEDSNEEEWACFKIFSSDT